MVHRVIMSARPRIIAGAASGTISASTHCWGLPLAPPQCQRAAPAGPGGCESPCVEIAAARWVSE